MTQQLYIKTDGPIPEDSPFEAGTAYRVNAMEFTRHGWGAWIGEHYVISSECGYLRMPDGTYGTWHFCDTSGNPVPVPWEEAAPQVDYRAHAEALAGALEMMVEMVEFGGFGKAAAMDTARAALAAYEAAAAPAWR